MRNWLVNLLFSLIYQKKNGIINDKERFTWLVGLDIREVYQLLDHEQSIMQELFFRSEDAKTRETFKGGYLALEKFKREIQTAKNRYFQAESIEGNEEETEEV